MSTVKANSVQIGQSNTASENFTLTVPAVPDGTVKLARGNQGATTQDVLSIDASGNIAAVVSISAPSLAVSGAVTAGSITSSGVSFQKMQLATAQNSTSGTAINFTDIPSWVKKITVMLSGVSTSGTSVVQLQLGTSSGVETTGYLSSAFRTNGTAIANTTSTTGLLSDFSIVATDVRTGICTLTLLNGTTNTWISNGSFGFGANSQSGSGTGSKSLSGTLDRIRITTVNGTDTFDAGAINLLYEGY